MNQYVVIDTLIKIHLKIPINSVKSFNLIDCIVVDSGKTVLVQFSLVFSLCMGFQAQDSHCLPSLSFPPFWDCLSILLISW